MVKINVTDYWWYPDTGCGGDMGFFHSKWKPYIPAEQDVCNEERNARSHLIEEGIRQLSEHDCQLNVT